MITGGEKLHYLAVKSISAQRNILRGITLNHVGDFYCLNYFHSYRTREKFKKHERACINHDYCYVKMSREDKKILKYNHGEKFLKVPFAFVVDTESLLKKIHSCQNDPKKSYTEKKATHIPSGYALLIRCSFDASKNKLDFYREKNCMERLCKDLRDQAIKIINYEKKEMIPLT